MSEQCPYLQIDKSNKEYICKAGVHHKKLAPHIAKLCKSELYKTCPDYQVAIGRILIK